MERTGLVQANNAIDANLAPRANLRPYISWRDFGAHLLHPESLKTFIMAYARDAILSGYSGNANLSYWNQLQASSAPGAAAHLRRCSPLRRIWPCRMTPSWACSTVGRQDGCPQSRARP
jgi:hypothetical protein